MTNPAPHEPSPSAASADQPESSETIEWAEMFVKYLQIEFYDVAGEPKENISEDQYRRWMMSAFLKTLAGMGMPPQNIDQLYHAQMATIDQGPEEPWSEAKNERRVELIDKSLQDQLTFDEAKELTRLTHQLRATFDNERFLPMKAAKQLHGRLLDLEAKRREQD